MVWQGGSTPDAGPVRCDALCRGLSPRLRVRSGRPPGHGRLAEAFSSLWPDHSSRKDGVACVPEAAKPSPLGYGQGDIRLSGIYPLLGQDTPWILGHQAEDGRETPAPGYERDMDMVSWESGVATPARERWRMRVTRVSSR